MESDNKVLWVVTVLALCAAAGAVIHHQRRNVEPPPAPMATAAPLSAPQNAAVQEPAKNTPAPPAPPLDLKQGDALLRQRANEISQNPKLSAWLKKEEPIRRLVASIESLADGQSPRESLAFMAPGKKFSVTKKGGQTYLDPGSYSRYNQLADVFASLNTTAMVTLLGELYPLLQDAAHELGGPQRDFRDCLVRGVKELLRAPIVERDIPLREKVISYAIAPMPDVKLEELSPAQKQMLRMGPKNTAKVQAKLREIALALGVPQAQLPKARTYSSQ